MRHDSRLAQLFRVQTCGVDDASPPASRAIVTDEKPDKRWESYWGCSSHMMSSSAGHYLKRRGIDPTLVETAGVRAGPWFGPREAIQFPLTNAVQQVVAVNGRYLTDESPKTRIGGKSRDAAFFSPGARDGQVVALVEAPIDALTLAACKIPAIALCGTRPLPHWVVRLLARRMVIVGSDADQAGDRAADQWARMLIYSTSVVRLRPWEAKDFNAMLGQVGSDVARLTTLLFHQTVAAYSRMVSEAAGLAGPPRLPRTALIDHTLDSLSLPQFINTMERIGYPFHHL